MKNQKYLLLIFSLFIGFTAVGEGISFSGKANKTNLQLNEYFKVEFKLQNEESIEFTEPKLKDFELVRGSFSKGDRADNNGYKFSHLYYFLKAKKSGKFTISGVSVQVGTKSYKANDIVINVSNTPYAPLMDEPAIENAKSNFHYKIELSKREALIGDTITASLMECNNSQLDYFRIDTKADYISKSIGFPYNSLKSKSSEIINGIKYKAKLAVACCVLAKEQGELQLGPATITIILEVKDTSGNTEYVPCTFFSDIVTLKVNDRTKIN